MQCLNDVHINRLENAKKSLRLNQKPPRRRPRRDPVIEIFEWDTFLQKEKKGDRKNDRKASTRTKLDVITGLWCLEFSFSCIFQRVVFCVVGGEGNLMSTNKKVFFWGCSLGRLAQKCDYKRCFWVLDIKTFFLPTVQKTIFPVFCLHLFQNVSSFFDLKFSGQSHTCKTPFDQLKPITLNEMQYPKVHEGHFLVCQVAVEPVPRIGLTTFIMDLKGKSSFIWF